VLGCLQGLDPTGVGARTPAECFALQLREKDRLDPLMQKLLDHLELLGQHDIATLKRRCGADDEDLAEMIAEIQALDPRPGLAYDHEVAQAVVPDVFVRRGADGAWRVELNGATLPKVLVNRRYASLVERAGCSREERAYLVDQINSANWLVKSLDQRANTILRVASEIVRQQETFLTHGVAYLKPLNLRAIAEAIEMHESTVSRVTSNKYMATPRGIFELKYFFTSAIASAAAGGEAHSAEAVKHKIRGLIDTEDAKAILSDDSLVDLLRTSGIDIARRTVAKYREAMRIPSSVQRRRQKRLTG
jgi:RNA polymerase sigma-54 factor